MARTIDPQQLTPHPYAMLFPALEEEDLAALAADLRAHGLASPITLFQGKVLDGRNRLAACLKGGVPPRFQTFKGSEAEAFARVVSANLHRRHLPAAQRAAIAAELLPMERALIEAERAEGREPSPGGKRGAAERVGKKLGVSAGSVRSAERVQEDAPDVFEALKSGSVGSLPEARALAALPDDERADALELPREERRARLARAAEADDGDPGNQAREGTKRALAELDALIGLAARVPHLTPSMRGPVRAILTEVIDEARERLADLDEVLSRAASDAA